MAFKKPPRLYNQDQRIRKVGFEFEFAGLEFNQVSDIIINVFGGKKEEISRYQQIVTGTKYGDFKLEFDSRFLKEKKYETFLKDLGFDIKTFSFHQKLEDIVASVSSNLVPFEIIMPPIPLNELDKVENFRKVLHLNKAEGTQVSPLYAFAFHINAELPDLSDRYILNMIKAFLLLQYWLVNNSQLSFTRQHLTSYINLFPDDYSTMVLNKTYQPSLNKLIKHYKLYNPTRNRPLDFYPLFVHLKGEKVKEQVDQPDLINPRPTYHYRLPDCRIDDPEWKLEDEWNSWILIEELAEDEDKLISMMEDFQSTYQSEYLNFRKKWSRKVNNYILNE